MLLKESFGVAIVAAMYIVSVVTVIVTGGV